MNRRYPLHTHISTLFILLTLLVGGSVGWLGYRVASDILRTSVADIGARIGAQTQAAFVDLIAPAEMATRLLRHDDLALARSFDERMTSLGLLREALAHSEALTSIYIGYGSGDFFLLRRMWDDSDRQVFGASADTAYVVQGLDHGATGPRGRYVFLDAALAVLKSEERPDYATAYDPRSRDWYKQALTAKGQVKTPPYIFHTSGKLGSTIANRTSRGDAVVASDIRLETLDRSLAQQKISPRAQIAIATQDGLTVAYQESGKAVLSPKERGGKPVHARVEDLAPVFRASMPMLETLKGGATTAGSSVTVGGEPWNVSIHPLMLEGTRQALYVITAIPDSELLASANALLQRSIVTVVIIIALAVPLAWLLARTVASPLRRLAGEAEAIRRFEFSKPIAVHSIVLEVDELSGTLDRMKQTIHRFLSISQAAAGEKNFERLLPRLLGETLSAANAQAGVLYLTADNALKPAAALFADGSALPDQPASIGLAAAGPLLKAALDTGQAQCKPLEARSNEMLGLDEAVRKSGATHAIGVPLRNREGTLVGAMLLLAREVADGARLAFVQALCGSAALSLEAKELIHAQKLLFEALIRLIAGAIDAKSPYTGGHCERVPELTKMLARSACAATDGPFASFTLDEEEWEAVHVAAWLHDCGKVTTPEYVVDKATKLETLYDRIHEVRMRFEVLKRDAQIACMKEIARGVPEAIAHARLAEAHRALDADFAFVAECNEGGELMAPAKLERLGAIAARTWMRTLDDRIGISHEEKERKSRTPAPALPVAEPLLADKPEHLFERQARERMAPDNPWGFRMRVPDLLYNKGEHYNLSVARGTLSDEERYKINEHIVQTFIMLEQLPFPRHLSAVPELASCHHEKMDGTGYPRRLTRDEMTPVGRMMAVADIFEALTAADRPYKKGKTLSEALSIMARMRDEQHIDADIFDLFLRAGVWRDYAKRFMHADQIDAVDVARFVAA